MICLPVLPRVPVRVGGGDAPPAGDSIDRGLTALARRGLGRFRSRLSPPTTQRGGRPWRAPRRLLRRLDVRRARPPGGCRSLLLLNPGTRGRGAAAVRAGHRDEARERHRAFRSSLSLYWLPGRRSAKGVPVAGSPWLTNRRSHGRSGLRDGGLPRPRGCRLTAPRAPPPLPTVSARAKRRHGRRRGRGRPPGRPHRAPRQRFGSVRHRKGYPTPAAPARVPRAGT
jgi:hypothetical protein